MPRPATVLPVARSGGHWVTHAPVQALLVPWSAWNSYSVRPWESTRIFPRLPLVATPTVAGCPAAVVAGCVEAVAPPPPPPQPATANATSGTAATAVSSGV